MEHEILFEKIGETYNQKLVAECEKIYLEEFTKKYPAYFETHHSKISALVSVMNKEKEITSIGMSKVDDLLLDSWGKMFGNILSGQGGFQGFTTDTGIGRNLITWGQSNGFATTNNGTVGSVCKLGTGLTPPARNDFNIETLYGGQFNTGDGGWVSGLGKITIPANYSAPSNAALSEVGLFGRWNDGNGQVTQYMLSHDALNPVVNVLTGQTINVDYELLLS